MEASNENLSRKGEPSYYCYLLSTSDTGRCLEGVKNRVHLGMHGGPV